jgi:uncharacterized repeat protein (TIGR03803 family)
VFRLAPDGTETVLYSFCRLGGRHCRDGAFPQGGLIMDTDGNLYGTTLQGGGIGVAGTVFKLAPDGTETVLYRFCRLGGTHCLLPAPGLIMDTAGNLYGTTFTGGADNGGTVFRLAPDGTETVLYSFCRLGGRYCRDGRSPAGGLIMDTDGNLYGATYYGGGGLGHAGTVFKLAPDGTETVLYRFCTVVDCRDGVRPSGGLIMDAAGNLYGTTANGGIGAGTVFKLAPDGTETVLYRFCRQSSCIDGARPAGGLIMDAAGNLYGSTQGGGIGEAGVVFALVKSP